MSGTGGEPQPTGASTSHDHRAGRYERSDIAMAMNDITMQASRENGLIPPRPTTRVGRGARRGEDKANRRHSADGNPQTSEASKHDGAAGRQKQDGEAKRKPQAVETKGGSEEAIPIRAVSTSSPQTIGEGGDDARQGMIAPELIPTTSGNGTEPHQSNDQ